MYTSLGDVLLKSGETVQAGVVTGPDEQWRERIETLLAHKGEDWHWQVRQLLTAELGVQGRFYLLHREGILLSHIMTVESEGVGLVGHVWTNPEDRGRGAASKLMALLMADFGSRQGRALHLDTAYDSPAYHIYRKHGFEGIEPGSGVMAYFKPSRTEFEAAYFAPGETNIAPLNWHHWTVASPLLAGAWPGVVRAASLGILHRTPSESPLIGPLRATQNHDTSHDTAGTEPRIVALQKSASRAVVGLAACAPDPLWPDTVLVDVYCHPAFWDKGGELLRALPLPPARRYLAYLEAEAAPKRAALEAAGFRQVAVLPAHLARAVASPDYADIAVLERTS